MKNIKIALQGLFFAAYIFVFLFALLHPQVNSMEIFHAGITYYFKSTANYGYGGFHQRDVGFFTTKEKAKQKLKEHIEECRKDPDFSLERDWIVPVQVE